MIKNRKICSKCASEKASDYCEHCKEETPTNLSTEVFEKHRLRGLFNIEFGGKGHKARLEVRSGWKESGDPKIKDGVYEDRIIDRGKNEYHQVVMDSDTSKVSHEEHQALTDHKQKK